MENKSNKSVSNARRTTSTSIKNKTTNNKKITSVNNIKKNNLSNSNIIKKTRIAPTNIASQNLYNQNLTSKQKTNNVTKKIIVKRKKKKNYYILGDIILIIILIGLVIFFINSLSKKEDDNNSEEEKNKTTDVTKTEEEIKLDKLNNINKKISFFKMEYIDRYIAYKDKNPDLDIEKVIVYVNIGLDQEFYTNVNDSPNKYNNKVLVNKYNYLGEDYVPKNLTKIDSKYSSDEKYMEKDAATSFEEMAKQAKKEGYNIRAVSTYRSFKYQTSLYNRYASSDGKEKADTYSARAGYSEHQTGLAVDVDNINTSYTSFGLTKEFEWMKENSYKYGFILRYTKETEFITGYVNEPWHYRYVGKEIALYIHNNPMTYEEYYVRFLDK